MKAVVCEAFGPPSALRLRDLPSPALGADQVLVRTRVAAVNYPDALIVAGKYQVKPPLPFTPGGELAGEIIAVGTGVKGLVPGDKVVGFTRLGAFAQETLVDASHAILLPPDTSDVDLELAGSIMLAYGTALHALQDRARAQPNETLLVLGAGGGVGLAAVEIGKLLGMRVIAAASTEQKLEAARTRGADATINYAHGDLRSEIKALTAGHGVDVAFDPVGGALTEPALRSVAWRGRHLVVGFAAGTIPRIPINLLLLKGSAMVGVFWGDFSRRQPDANLRNVKQLLGWLHAHSLHPLVSVRYPLSRAAQALDALLSRAAIGKLILLPQQID